MPAVPVTLSTYAPTGSAVRLRATQGTSSSAADEQAMTESPAGSGQFLYLGNLTLTDDTGPFYWEARIVTAQTQVAYDASTNIARTRGLLGWVVDGVMLDAATDLRGVNGGPFTLDETLSGNLSSIRAQTDKITSSNVFVVNRIARGEITIHQGDSYSSTGLTLAIPKPDGATYPADLTGWTVTLQANLRDTTGATGTTHFSVALTVTNPATTQDLTLDNLPASTTSTLEVGNADQAAAWDFQIVATKGSDAVTLIEGPLTVVKRQGG